MNSTTKSRTRRKQNIITLKDVALQAGVSQMTASVVLNGSKPGVPVADDTRQRVLRAAEEMGYQTNGAAKAIATGKFGCVALLLSTQPHVSTLPQRVLEGIHDALAERDMHLALFRLPDEQITDAQKLPKILRQSMADGLIVDYTHRIPAQLVELIEKNHLQAVWFNTLRNTDCVRPDDYAAARKATEHLIDHGHRRIAYVDFQPLSADVEVHFSVEHRRDGYSEAMRAAGLKPDLRTGIRKAIEQEERAPLLAKWLGARQRPTAMLCYGDNDANKALFAAYRLGLRVPHDLSLITFSRQGIWPHGEQITRFASPEPEMGRALVDMLLQKIEQPQGSMPARLMPYEFIEGQSVAPLRRKS